MSNVIFNNTYGFRSISNDTFNQERGDRYTYPKEQRDLIVTGLRVHNLLLMVAGYTDRFKMIGGCARMLSGSVIGGATLTIGDRNIERGVIIGRYYDEALQTSGIQMTRGILEAFVPYGWVVNATLDVVATPINLFGHIPTGDFHGGVPGVEPHQDPDYPLPLWPLYCV